MHVLFSCGSKALVVPTVTYSWNSRQCSIGSQQWIIIFMSCNIHTVKSYFLVLAQAEMYCQHFYHMQPEHHLIRQWHVVQRYLSLWHLQGETSDSFFVKISTCWRRVVNSSRTAAICDSSSAITGTRDLFTAQNVAISSWHECSSTILRMFIMSSAEDLILLIPDRFFEKFWILRQSMRWAAWTSNCLAWSKNPIESF